MFRNRFSKNALLIALGGMLALLGAQTASAAGERHVFLRFAGDFVQSIEQTDVDAMGVPTGTTSTRGIIRGQARGNLGRATVTAVGGSEGGPPAFDERCPEDFLRVTLITPNSLVLTFRDLSLLYGDGEGVVCVNFATGEDYTAIDGVWLGGTGRFEGATGEFSIRLDTFTRVNAKTQLIAETGTITGTLRCNR